MSPPSAMTVYLRGIQQLDISVHVQDKVPPPPITTTLKAGIEHALRSSQVSSVENSRNDSLWLNAEMGFIVRATTNSANLYPGLNGACTVPGFLR